MAGNETIYSDCSGVVDGFAKGRRWCLRPDCFHAGIWKLIWDILDPGHEVNVTKVKAHKSEAACNGDPMQLWLRKGNVAADGYAKAGTRRHPVRLFDLERQKAHVAMVKMVQIWLARANTAWPQPPNSADWRMARKAPRKKALRQLCKVREPVKGGHRWEWASDTLRCSVCLTTARSPKSKRRRANEVCRGSIINEVALGADRTHCFWYSKPLGDNRLPVVVWCSKCGAFATQKLRNLLAPCEKKNYPSAGTLLRKLQQGWHPQGRYQLQAPVRLEGELLKSFRQFAIDRKETAGLHKTEDVAASPEWEEALGLPSQKSASSDLANPDELFVFKPDANFDPSAADDFDSYMWGFGLDEE